MADVIIALKVKLNSGEKPRCDHCGSRCWPSGVRIYASKNTKYEDVCVVYWLCRDCEERVKITNTSDRIVARLEDKFEAALERSLSQ